MPADQHATLRAVSALAQGIQKDVDAHRKETATDALLEREIQYQLPVGGTATAEPSEAIWGTVSFNFEHSFPSVSQGMRDSDLETPQVSFGWQLKTGTPVALFASVRNWVYDDTKNITGVRLSVSALALGSSDDVDFRAVLHLTIQGWGAPTDTFEDTEGS